MAELGCFRDKDDVSMGYEWYYLDHDTREQIKWEKEATVSAGYDLGGLNVNFSTNNSPARCVQFCKKEG